MSDTIMVPLPSKADWEIEPDWTERGDTHIFVVFGLFEEAADDRHFKDEINGARMVGAMLLNRIGERST